MRKVLIILLIGFISSLIQGTIFRTLFSSLAIPNLVTIIVCFLALYEVNALGVFLAFLLGLELDICSGVLVGPWCGAYILTYAVLSSLSPRIFIESGVAAFVVVSCASFFSAFMYVTLTYQFRPGASPSVGIFFLEALCTGIVAPIGFKILKRFLMSGDSARQYFSA